MKLSFVIPAYNEVNYIDRCLESILAESKNCSIETEIIVVNNASLDRTAEVAASYVGVRVIEETRKGLVWARQAGFSAATGELVANVDADNVLPRGWINRVVAEFSQDKELTALSGPFIYYDLSWWVNLETKIFYLLGYLTYLFNRLVFRRGVMLQGGNFVARRSALEAVGGFDTKIDFYGEDTDIARRLQKVGRVKFVFGFQMYSSGRRLAKEGVLITGMRYAVNYFLVLIFGHPFSQKSTDVRSDDAE